MEEYHQCVAYCVAAGEDESLSFFVKRLWVRDWVVFRIGRVQEVVIDDLVVR